MWRLGTGRVWSLMIMVQVFFPAASSRRRGGVDRGRHGRPDQAIFGIRRLELTDVGFQNLRTDKVVMQRHAGISERNYNRHL